MDWQHLFHERPDDNQLVRRKEMGLYRVEKDGITFYIQPHMLGYYASEGYAIYKTVEEEVIDVEGEVASIDSTGESAAIGGHDAREL